MYQPCHHGSGVEMTERVIGKERNFPEGRPQGIWTFIIRVGCLLFVIHGTSKAQPTPDMNTSGCVDLYDVALFQNQFGTSDISGLAPCDFIVDGFCNFNDYADLASVLRGPICDCDSDLDCIDPFPCTDDNCYAGACRHTVNCPNQDDGDADCVHENCTITGCVADDEPDASPCGEGLCNSGACCFPSGAGPCTADTDCCDANAVCAGSTCCYPLGVNGCSTDIECCTGFCVGGTCCPNSGDGACTVNADCCNADEVCVGTACCFPLGVNGCSNDGECCAGFCTGGTCCPDSGNGACTVDQDCCNPDAVCVGTACCFPLGANGCSNDPDCCTGPCTGGTCCFPSGGGAWTADQECCDANAVCAGTTCCLPPGVNGCSDSADCCAGPCIGGSCCFPLGDGACSDDAQCCGLGPGCFRAACSTAATCILANEPDGTPCDDGVNCTTSEQCTAGQCVAGLLIDSACPNQDLCDNDCVQFFCNPTVGCVPGFEPDSAPCFLQSCVSFGFFNACDATGSCQCRISPPPDFGCP